MNDDKTAPAPAPAPVEAGQKVEAGKSDEVSRAKERDEKLKKKLEALRESDPFVYPMF
jgi:hypothetical protein